MRRCARVTVETSEPLWPSTRAAKMSRGTKQKTKKKKIERKVSQCVNLCKWVMCANCCPPTPTRTPEIPEKKSPKRAKSGDTCFFLPCTFCCCAIVFHLSREIYALPDALDLLPDCLPACPARGRSLSSGQRGVCVIQMRLKVCGAFLYGERESMQRFFCQLLQRLQTH